MLSVHKRYVDTSFGQIHARVVAAAGEESQPPLLCLHPAPASGLYFATAFPYLNAHRRIIAPDYPGYGGSDPLAEPPGIDDYAKAMLELVDAMEISGAVDVLGFHTGCLVGAEMALQRPDGVRRLLLCDVPFFSPEVRPGLFEKMAVPMPIDSTLDSISNAWAFNVENRLADVPLPRAFELFAEHLRAADRDYFGFAAAFTYASEERFPLITVDTTVLATQSGLHGPSVSAAEAIPDATFVDVTEVKTAVFESGAEAISRRIDSALS